MVMVHNIRKPKRPSRAGLTIVWRRIETLRPDAENFRVHSPKQVRQLACSISNFGFNVPILVNPSMRVLAGHARLLAARELGWREVPTILLGHLNETETQAFMLADNCLAEAATWRGGLPLEKIRELSAADPELTEGIGFEPDRVDRPLAAGPNAERRRRNPSGVAGSPAQPSICRVGDQWLLDRHRVVCSNLSAVHGMLAAEAGMIVVVTTSPASADAVIRRWQAATGCAARHEVTGCCFQETATASDPGKPLAD